MTYYYCKPSDELLTKEQWKKYISSFYSKDAGVPEPADSWERFSRLVKLEEMKYEEK